MAEIYRKWQDIYDAQTNKRIPDVATLQRDYAWAREVSRPWATDVWNVPTTAGSTPAIVRPWQYGMSDWRSYQALRDAAAEVIKIRQQGNKDIIEPTSYWKGQMRWASDPMAQDTQLRELSPADQAWLRMSGRATASAALSSLDDERQYRERIAGTQLQTLDSMYDNQQKERDIDLTNTYRNRQLEQDAEFKKIEANQRAFEAWMPLPYPGLWLDSSTPIDSSKITIDSFLNAVWKQESRWRYDAENERTKAYWKFQILPSNWPSWSQEYIKANPNEFKNQSIWVLPNTPEYQEKLAKFKMQQYFDKYGNWEDVASMWYSGRPFSQVIREGWADKKQGKGNEPSVREYVNQTLWKISWVTPSNTITTKNNSLSKSEMEDLSFATGISIWEIASLQPNEVRALEVKVKSQWSENKTAESHADSADGKKIQTTFWLSREEAVLLFQAIAGGITDSERSELNKVGISNEAIDAAVEISTYGSISSWFGSKIVK